MKPRSGPRESLLLAIRLLGLIFLVSGGCDLIVRLAIALQLGIREIDLWRHFGPITFVLPIFGTLMLSLATTFTRVILRDEFGEVMWNPDLRIPLERFGIALAGMAFLFHAMGMLVEGWRTFSGWHGQQFGLPTVISSSLLGLTFLLAARRLHALLLQYKPARI